MIPRVFHRVWLGGKPMPDIFTEWGESWLRHHPDWSMKTWTEKEIAGLKNVDLLPRCSCLAQQADIVRYEVLFNEGGIYIDTDFECFRNIDALIEELDFFACYQIREFMSNAIFGGVPGHKILGDLFRETRPSFKADPWNSMGPSFLTPIVNRYPEARVFERKTFIPYTWAEYYAFHPNWPVRGITPPGGSYSINHRASIWYEDSKKKL